MEKQILVTKSSMPTVEEYSEEIKPIFESRWLTNCGPVHNKLKHQLEEFMGVENVELFTNGHQALLAAYRALGLKGEVITTPFTFVSTTHSIADSGLTPVFCDVKEDYTIDENKIEDLITENTVAIMPVHVYGNICNVDKIQEIADKHGLKIIYDGAHAFGEIVNGKNVGSYGDITMFSFHATKAFNTIEGGCLVVKDKKIADKIAKERNFGIDGEDIYSIGTNAKMNEFQAAMGICNLRHLEEEFAKREIAYNAYNTALNGVKGIVLNAKQAIRRNYAYYPILITEEYGLTRDEVVELLKNHNIFARKYFYPATNEFSCYKYLGKSTTPIAHEYSKNILCLPMFADLTVEDVNRIANILINKK